MSDQSDQDEAGDYKESSAHGITMMRALLPSVQEFVVTVKEVIENPSIDTSQEMTSAGIATASMGGMKTATLRIVAEKMEEFAANLGKVSAFIRLATNRFGPQSLEQERKAVERILNEIKREQVEEISRYMDRNYVGTLDHERGAVVSGRYVGAIPRIKDAISLLIESLDSAKELLGSDAKNTAPTLAEQTFGEETLDLFNESTVITPFGAMGGLFVDKPTSPPITPVPESPIATPSKAAFAEDDDWFGGMAGGQQQPLTPNSNTILQHTAPIQHHAAVPTENIDAAAPMTSGNDQHLSPAVLALNELITTYSHLLLHDPNAAHLEDAIKTLQATKNTLLSIEKQI